jgi:hypothetical protein
MFDALMMLTRGRTVYFGPRGQAAVDYALSSWPNKGVKGDNVANPAEFLVDLITGADREGRAAAFADTYAASPLAASNVQRLDEYIEAAATTKLPDHLAAELSVDHETVTPVWWGLKTLVKYRTPRNYKDPEFLGPRIGDKFLMTVLQWSLYWQIGGKFYGNNYANISAILFMFIVLPAYGAASYVPAIVLERRLYMRERADGLYYAITYLLAKLLDELMVATLASLPLCAASFYAMDLQNSFALFWGACALWISQHDCAFANRAIHSAMDSRIPPSPLHRRRAGVRHRRNLAQHGRRQRAAARLGHHPAAVGRLREQHQRHARLVEGAAAACAAAALRRALTFPCTRSVAVVFVHRLPALRLGGAHGQPVQRRAGRPGVDRRQDGAGAL